MHEHCACCETIFVVREFISKFKILLIFPKKILASQGGRVALFFANIFKG